jgi:hypothetical protein
MNKGMNNAPNNFIFIDLFSYLCYFFNIMKVYLNIKYVREY